jgi:hypothetical protein
VEWWSSGPDGFAQRNAGTIDGEAGPDLRSLERAIQSLLEPHQADLKGCRLDVVIESAWLPVVAIETRKQLLNQVELDALLRHRLQHARLDGSTAAPEWETRFVHQPGDELALGFAIDLRLKDLLVEQFGSRQARTLSIQPAFTWGWDASVGQRREACMASSTGSTWWLWEESDRTLAALAGRRHVRVMNVAAPLLGRQDAKTLAKREALRSGVQQADTSAVVGGWDGASSRPDPRKPSLDFRRVPGQPSLGWVLLILGVVAAGSALALHRHRESIRAQEDLKIEARAAAERREREIALRPRVPTPEGRRLSHIQPELDRPWLPLMRAIESATEPPVFLLGLSTDPAGARLQIDAEASSFDEAMAYVQRLADVEFLKAVQIVSHENTVDPWGRPSVKFTVVARWSVL